MGRWQPQVSRTWDWATPPEIFAALGCRFDMDPAAAQSGAVDHVPARRKLREGGLEVSWRGFVWLNPPWGGRNGLAPWLCKFCVHANGIACVPDRTSAPWFQEAAQQCHYVLFCSPRPQFLRPDGTRPTGPGGGAALLGVGAQAVVALLRAQERGLGLRCRVMA